ncbi:MAG: DUF3078 domain-containing protein [Bacteroidales bacterium]
MRIQKVFFAILGLILLVMPGFGQVNHNHQWYRDTLKIPRDSIIRMLIVKDSLLGVAKMDSVRLAKKVAVAERSKDSLFNRLSEMRMERELDSIERIRQFELTRNFNQRARWELIDPVDEIYEDSVRGAMADLLNLVFEDTAFSPYPRQLKYSFSRLVHHLINDSIHLQIINLKQDTIPFVLKANRADSTAFFLMNVKQDSAKVFLRSHDRNTMVMWLEEGLDLKRLFRKHVTADMIKVSWAKPDKYRIARRPVPQPAPKIWDTGAEFSATLSQVAYSHWAKGGNNNMALSTEVKARANYVKGSLRWDNLFWFQYGLQKAELVSLRKSQDRLEIRSALSHKAFKKFDYSVGLNLITQSFAGYDYPNDSVRISHFLAPGILDLNVGMVYRPNKKFTANFSPASGKFTAVLDSTLAQLPRYGNQGKLIRPEVGARVTIDYKTLLFNNVNLNTQLKLFSSYVNHPERVDIDWYMALDLKVNKYLTTSIKTQLMYDDDVLIPLFEIQDGKKVKVGEGKRVQFWEYIGVGFKYHLY